MAQPEVQIDGQNLVIQWDNRTIIKSRALWGAQIAFWLFWTPLTAIAPQLVSIKDEPSFLLWQVPAFVVVVFLPLSWLSRISSERIEISPTTYRHYCVNYPWLFPKHWPADKITRKVLGRANEESVRTLSIYRGWRRDLLGYWTTNEFRQQLFALICEHLDRIQLTIEIEAAD